MKRLFQLLLAAIGILGVVVVAAVVYVTTFLDPEDLKPHLVALAREHSGLELELDGPLSWSFYPRVGVSIADVEGRLPDQSGEAPILAFDRAEVSLSFATLLRGQVAIEGVTLDGVRLRLVRDAEGQGNWEPLLERLAEPRRTAESTPTPPPASAGVNPLGAGNLSVALNVASVQVRNGKVLLRDLGSEQEWLLDSLSLTGSNVNPRRDFPLRASFRLARYGALDWRELERPPALSSEITLEGRARLALAERHYELAGFTLSTATRAWGDEATQPLTLSGERLSLDLVDQHLALEAGQLESELQHPRLGEEALPLTLDFALDADLAEQSAQLRDLVLSGPDGLNLRGSLNLTDLAAAPAYRGQLNLAPLSLRPWLERLGQLPDTADPEALTEVALTSPVEGDLSRLALTGLTLALDDSTFTGRLAAGLDGESLDIALQGDTLDLDAYLPPDGAAGEATASRSLPGVSRVFAQEDQAPLVPAAWLAELSLDSELALERLRLLGLDFTQVELALAGDDGQQRLERFSSRLYDGSLAATGALDLTRDPIHWHLAPTLSRVRLEPLHQAFNRNEAPAPLRGRLTAEGALNTSGNTWSRLRRHLSGNLNARVEEGAILNVNVSRELCSVAAVLEGEEMTREWSEETRFDRAAMSVAIRDGVARSDDIEIAVPGIAVNGEGELDLVTERFELRAATRFVDTADAACEVNPRLEQVPLPVRCSGRYTGDSSEWCRFDREAFQQTLTELLRDEVERQAGEAVEERLGGALEELDERIGEEAGKELRDALRGLFD